MERSRASRALTPAGGLLAWVLLAGVLLVGAPVASAVPGPQAGTAERARAQAEAAAADVDALAVRLAGQVAAEEEALLGVARTVQTSVTALAEADRAAAEAAVARARQSRTVRALYSSGGELAVFASVLGSASLDDLAERQRMARRLLSSAADDSRDAADSLAEAGARADAADAEVAARLTTAADVAQAGAAVQATLTEARQRLEVLGEEAARLTVAEEARRRWEAAEAAASAARAAAASSAAAGVSAIGIPDGYRALYVQAAGTCPGLRWSLLAAVGQAESRHGQVNGPSSAGAVGPMQFMPRTFAAYGVDADGDGAADPWSPADAVFSAARYLCASGAGGRTAETDRRALLRYNNAQWYVDLVLAVERDLLTRATAG